MKVKKHDQTKI